MEVKNQRAVWQFATKYPNSDSPLKHWIGAVRAANWNNPADILNTFNSADSVGNQKWIFDVGGGNYRIAAMVWFQAQTVFVLKVMTHAEHDKEKF